MLKILLELAAAAVQLEEIVVGVGIQIVEVGKMVVVVEILVVLEQVLGLVHGRGLVGIWVG